MTFHFLQADDIALTAGKNYLQFMANTVHIWCEGWLVVHWLPTSQILDHFCGTELVPHCLHEIMKM